MTRFLLGFATGAIVIAFVQFIYAPLRTSTQEEHTVNDSSRMSVTGSLETSPDGGVAAGDIQLEESMNQRGSGMVASSSISADENEPLNSDVGESQADNGTPPNPIELPATHAGFVNKNTPSLPDEHSAIEQEEVDPVWAELVERLILSHISSHPQGQSIAIISLVCRTTRCEIVGTVYGDQGGDVWDEVLGSMLQQSWFATYFTPSMFGSGGSFPGEYRFITILARVVTEIEPPVEP